MVDKAEPINLSGLGYVQSGLGRDHSGLGRDQSGLGRDHSNYGHNLANCSCGHESNNHAARQPWNFLVTGYGLIGLWCGTIPGVWSHGQVATMVGGVEVGGFATFWLTTVDKFAHFENSMSLTGK
jgi:hypothetical protein